MTATLEVSPIPSHRISRGKIAIFGMGKVAAMIGFPTASGTLKNPIQIPTATPRRHATENPQRMRLRLAKRCLKIIPVQSMAHPSETISVGAGRKRGGTHCLRLTISQIRRITKKEDALIQGCSFICRKAVLSWTTNLSSRKPLGELSPFLFEELLP
jgi:hypothetical protein